MAVMGALGKADHPTPAMYEHAAWMLMVETEALQAVGQVEAGTYGAFLDSGEPVVLFERHKFSEFTGNRHDGIEMPKPEGIKLANPREQLLISSRVPAYKTGGYGPVSLQHHKLAFAVRLDEDAALKSCSWGLFQIMGFNHSRAGYPALQRFINAMYRDVSDHLRALTMYLRSDHHLVDALRQHNWATFARLYNGSDYRAGRYDEKLADAYREFMEQR